MLPWRLPAVSPSFVAPDHRLVSDGTLVADAALGHRSVHNGLQTQHIGENMRFDARSPSIKLKQARRAERRLSARRRRWSMRHDGRGRPMPRCAFGGTASDGYALLSARLPFRHGSALGTVAGIRWLGTRTGSEAQAAYGKLHEASCTRPTANSRTDTLRPQERKHRYETHERKLRSICSSEKTRRSRREERLYRGRGIGGTRRRRVPDPRRLYERRSHPRTRGARGAGRLFRR